MNALRRRFVSLAATATVVLAVSAGARAQSDPAALVQRIGTELVQIVNAPGTPQSKTGQLQPVIDGNIAVDQIARFCLGHYWRAATPAQQTQYMQLFHSVLLNSIVSHLGSYHGVQFTMGGTRPGTEGTLVETVINRPGEAPATVEWVVSGDKVIDVVAEGASLRSTEQADYTSYLARHGGDVAALIAAMQRQAARNGG